MKNKRGIALTLLMVFVLIIAPAAWAFSDISQDPAEAEIRALHQDGIISGISETEFMPKGKLNYAQGVHLIVNALDLNIDEIKFIKEPKASDYFSQVPDDAWYAASLMIAQLNGLPLAKDLDPEQRLTREQFADLLYKAVELTGDYAFIEIYMSFADEEQVDKEYMTSIQRLLISNIAETNADGLFRPKDEITRSEASRMIHAARKFVKANKEHSPEPPAQNSEVELIMEKVNDQINKATVTWGMKGNSGYRVTIDRIEFQDEQATLYYTLHEPIPGHMYAQVMTEAKAETYVDSRYTVVIEPNLSSGVSSPAFPGESSSTSAEAQAKQ